MMIRRMNRTFFSCVLMIGLFGLSWNSACCQEYDTAQTTNDQNALYFSAGTSILWHGASLSYERTLKEKLFNKNISSFAKLGVGYYLMWDWSPEYGGPWTFSNYGWLIGKHAHLFEASAGITYIFSGDLQGLFPSGAFGYRYRSSDGNFIFRANASFPEALNLGVGFTL